MNLPQLEDWSKRIELKTLSRERHYTTAFEADPAWVRNKAVLFDLREAGEVAEIRVNGETGADASDRPYRANGCGANQTRHK